MFRRILNPNREPLMLKVNVLTNAKQLIGVAVYCGRKPYTFYTYSKTNVNGSRIIDVRLPLCPKVGYLRIWNAGATNNADAERGFKVLAIKKEPLTTNLNVFDSKNKTLTDFLRFAERFSECASYISTKTPTSDKSIYTSYDGKFVIEYVDEIIGDDGKPRTTSMRVNNKTGVMQLAKKYVIKYTVPERMAILLHEFAHFYLNKVHSDEFEADMNALMIYCGLGYPRKEGGTAWAKVFFRNPSPLNIERMKRTFNFLKNFDRTDFKIIR